MKRSFPPRDRIDILRSVEGEFTCSREIMRGTYVIHMVKVQPKNATYLWGFGK